MRKSFFGFSGWALASALLIGGCGTGGAVQGPAMGSPAMSSSASMRAPEASPSFAVSGAVNRPMRFDLAALQALPATTQTVAGHAYTGVSLWSLLNATTGIKTDPATKNATLSMVVLATGSDGYKAVVSLAEIDPGFGNRNALIAYAIDGAALGGNGMARLVVPGDVKAGRSVARLARIEVFAAAGAP
jgi:DMSO/TMAO reductase YedYZ molybdopterin-dependent catalytic subunit